MALIIATLVKGMEDYKDQFIVILAGYEAEMDWFLSTNPGLPSRFPIHIHFPDYDAETLFHIAKRTVAGRQYRLSVDAEIKLRTQIRQALQSLPRGEPFSNARWVRNLVERAVRHQAVRLFEVNSPKREELLTLQAVDFVQEASR
ncbi:AAA family ATPase [Alicyclobacillus suci]|uniref:AAA family ATPase n=1 Tax=Alicyclobacillus suci TaxID=2816080 RepID=UPI0011BD542A|nr:AAA family ATPase [Alicyclobacillus suci]